MVSTETSIPVTLLSGRAVDNNGAETASRKRKRVKKVLKFIFVYSTNKIALLLFVAEALMRAKLLEKNNRIGNKIHILRWLNFIYTCSKLDI